jgi:hypothetical protein
MSALDRIAHFENRRDEAPNCKLARVLATKKDRRGVREIAKNLWNQDKAIQADCIKVLYEVGYLEPALIAEHAEEFIKLLKSRNNRLVWGGMIALGTVADLKPDIVFAHLSDIRKAMDKGSVITVDNGVQALARAASKRDEYRRAIFPHLIKHLKICRPKDVAQHSEKSLPAVNSSNKKDFIAVLEARLEELSGSARARVSKVIKEAGNR